MITGNSKVNKLCQKYRRQNIKKPTPAEAAFLDLIKEYKVKIIKQYPIFTRNGFILIDFCAPKYRLAFEIDGGKHRLKNKTKKSYEAWRERHIANHGLVLFRFRNEEILKPSNDLMPFFKYIFKK